MSTLKQDMGRIIGEVIADHAACWPGDCSVCYPPESRILRIFRWRGAWNWKDITERMIAGFVAGLAAGLSFWVMERMFG